jgi:8-oxo-dGTP pyrophosphatase MutT (NUDIX family)
MNYSEFLKIYEELNDINSALLVESTIKEVNLADCRMITSDVVDVRGELEKNACLVYNNELTRVQVRTVIIRETKKGKEFLAKKFQYRTDLPGGGYDAEKDNGDILNSAKREAYEEVNLNLSNLKDTGVRTWKHREDP